MKKSNSKLQKKKKIHIFVALKCENKRKNYNKKIDKKKTVLKTRRKFKQ